MQVSYNEACTLHNSTLEQDLIFSEEAGFDYIELRLDKLKEYFLTHTIDDLKDFFAHSHIRPHALNGIYVYTNFLSKKDDTVRSSNLHASNLMNDITFGCEVCQALSVKDIIMVPPLFSEEENKIYSDPWNKVVEDNVRIFTQMGDYVKKYGLRIGIEIVGAPRSSIRTIRQCNEILDLIGRDNVGYTIDAFNLYLFNKDDSFNDILDAYPEKIFVVHINGGEKGSLGELRQSYRTFADRGSMNVENYLGNLKKIGYDGPVSIEFFRHDCWRRPAKEVINECYKTTKAIMQKCKVI